MAKRRLRYLLHGSRCSLRRPTVADGPELVALARASRRSHRPWVTPPQDEQAFHTYLCRGRRDDTDHLLLCHTADHAIIGVFNLSQIFYGPFRSAYLGYWVGGVWEGQGYMSEGIDLVLEHSFTTLGLHRVEANVQPDNERSIRLIGRCGFRREGYSPRYLHIGGRWVDHERWAILAEEWGAIARKKRESTASQK